MFKEVGPTCLVQLYMSIVLPHLDYCSPVCDPYHMSHSERLEKGQSFAARVICSNYVVPQCSGLSNEIFASVSESGKQAAMQQAQHLPQDTELNLHYFLLILLECTKQVCVPQELHAPELPLHQDWHSLKWSVIDH